MIYDSYELLCGIRTYIDWVKRNLWTPLTKKKINKKNEMGFTKIKRTGDLSKIK